jgi:hypothetical protein
MAMGILHMLENGRNNGKKGSDMNKETCVDIKRSMCNDRETATDREAHRYSIRARAHQGNWQPQGNRNSREKSPISSR